MKSGKMGERNTWPCRGCGKPHLEEVARNIHEANCPQLDEPPEPEEPEEAEPDSMEDQDQWNTQPQEAEPDVEPSVQADPKPPEPPEPRVEPEEPAGCRCCGADVGNTTRKGLCFGCDLAGCSPEGTRCKHRTGGTA